MQSLNFKGCSSSLKNTKPSTSSERIISYFAMFDFSLSTILAYVSQTQPFNENLLVQKISSLSRMHKAHAPHLRGNSSGNVNKAVECKFTSRQFNYLFRKALKSITKAYFSPNWGSTQLDLLKLVFKKQVVLST